MPNLRISAAIAAAVLTVAFGAMAPAGAQAAPSAPRLASAPAAATAQPHPQAATNTRAPRIAQHPTRRACARQDRPGVMACMAVIRTDVASHKGLFRHGLTAQSAPSGYGPSDLWSAYDLATAAAAAGGGETVAVVDALDDPAAEADLQVYRAQYGLPPCTTANGCFEKVNQEGQQGNYPAASSSWATEESLDVDMVSAICPNCHIMLVEANSTQISDLGAAVDEAVALGAKFVSNSYGGTEDAAELQDDQYYNHPGVVITASGGDSGYGVNYPSASQYVTAVGGTTLVPIDGSCPAGTFPDHGETWCEGVWGNGQSGTDGDGTGSGCSAYEPVPSWQESFTVGGGDNKNTTCAGRVTNDVSAVADPNTGVAVYDSYGEGGWLVVGGTSVSSPIIASTYALAGLPGPGTYPSSYPYANAVASGGAVDDKGLNLITVGANGTCPPPPNFFLCQANVGYSGPTGLGTPNGVAAFRYSVPGTLTGTVTDAATGKPVAGAQVGVPGESVTTGSDGSYTISLLPASYRVTISDYGYLTQTATITITANQTTTQNFQLSGTPHEAVSGTVTAATGTPWPVYAQVTWTDPQGHTGFTFTNPATGGYTLSLYENSVYTLQVTSLYPEPRQSAPVDPAYEPGSAQVLLGTGPVTQDFTLGVNMLACTAIGYQASYAGTTQTFAGASAPPGWTVTNTNLGYPGYSDQPGWVFTDAGQRGNQTGGAGGFAIVDSDNSGQFHYQDTKLISPVVSMAADTTPVVQFATSLQPAVNSTATVDVSTDGGTTWATVWTSQGFPGVPGPQTVTVALPQAAGKTSVRVRFGYTGQWSQYWELGDVFFGNKTCAQQTGGLVTGRIADAGGNAINGATVASVTDPGDTATSVDTPGDTTINGGLYWLFIAATGSQQFTASETGLTPSTQSATITADQVSTLNFTLGASSSTSAGPPVR